MSAPQSLSFSVRYIKGVIESEFLGYDLDDRYALLCELSDLVESMLNVAEDELAEQEETR